MIDLRDDAETIEKLSKVKQRPISIEAAEKLASELKAVKYVECSALTQEGLKNVFEEAVLAAIKGSEPTKKGGWLHMPKVPLPNLFKGELFCHAFKQLRHIVCIAYVCVHMCVYYTHLGGGEKAAVQSEAQPPKHKVTDLMFCIWKSISKLHITVAHAP